MKARPVPYAMTEAVDRDLDQMIKDGIISPVDYSDWATPIVCVPKKQGNVRICGDFRSTINPVLENNSYPLPNPNNIFAQLNGGKKYSCLDMSSAYLQLKLDSESQKLLTINTHRGLFRYHRLVFGLSVSPLIFQKVVDTLLKDCLLYTSPSPRDKRQSRMPSSA